MLRAPPKKPTSCLFPPKSQLPGDSTCIKIEKARIKERMRGRERECWITSIAIKHLCWEGWNKSFIRSSLCLPLRWYLLEPNPCSWMFIHTALLSTFLSLRIFSSRGLYTYVFIVLYPALISEFLLAIFLLEEDPIRRMRGNWGRHTSGKDKSVARKKHEPILYSVYLVKKIDVRIKIHMAVSQMMEGPGCQ